MDFDFALIVIMASAGMMALVRIARMVFLEKAGLKCLPHDFSVKSKSFSHSSAGWGLYSYRSEENRVFCRKCGFELIR